MVRPQKVQPPATQSYATHRAWPRPHVLAAALVLFANVGVAAVALVRAPGPASAWGLVVAAALVVVALSARRHAQIVQDRVIRLEQRLRLERLLPPARHPDLARLTLPQLIALRFAGDAELPALVELALAGQGPDALKRAVRDWQADRLRV